MIRYDLICSNGHEFDSWFTSSSAFDEQNRAGFVGCPFCESVEISKRLMRPGITGKSNRKDDKPLATSDPKLKQMVEMIRQMRRHVEKNAEYVGREFASEARKIHYEEAPARGIYGEATLEDAKSLHEEGVEVHALPELPEEKN